MTPHRRRPLRARNVPTNAQVGGRDVAMQDLTPWTREVLSCCRQLFQTRQHDAARRHRHCGGIATRQAANSVVRLYERVDTQRRHNGIVVRRFSCAVGAGEDGDAVCLPFGHLACGR